MQRVIESLNKMIDGCLDDRGNFDTNYGSIRVTADWLKTLREMLEGYVKREENRKQERNVASKINDILEIAFAVQELLLKSEGKNEK